MRRFLPLMILMIIVSASLAEFVDVSKAETLARNYIKLRAENHADFTIRDRNIINNRYTGGLSFYVFRLEPVGYIAVSSDTRIRPVLAWSLSNSCHITPPDNKMIQLIHDDMHNRQLALENMPPDMIAQNEQMWHDYLNLTSDVIMSYDDLTTWGPFVRTQWNQGHPFNRFTPYDPETGEKTPTGCVPAAVIQILHYWELPYRLRLDESHSYYSEATDPPIWIDATTADMDTIDWNNSTTRFGPCDSTLAMVSWAVGVALQAQYKDGGTAAHCDAASFYRFGFARAEDWRPGVPNVRNIIRENVQKGMIAYMSFSGEGGGHAAVIDGYEESGSYHINMGWGGYEDGWYYVFDETPLHFIAITGMVLNLTGQYHWDIPNNMSEAYEIVPRTHLRKVINAINPTDDIDWYKFYAKDDSTYFLSTSGPNDMYLELYDSLGDMIFRADTGGQGNNVRVYWYPDVDACGYYYLKVGANSSFNDVNYKLWYSRRTGPERPFINITRPSGGETAIGGDRMGIIFTKGGEPAVNYVSIEYSTSGRRGPWHTIVDSLMGTYYMWNVPIIEEELYDYWGCYIRIYDPYDGLAEAISSSPFRMRHPDAVLEQITKSDQLFIGASPNPFNSSVRIDHRNIENASLTIYNTDGRVILTQELAEGTNSTFWNVGKELPGGIYLAEFTGSYNNKAVKELIKLVYMK